MSKNTNPSAPLNLVKKEDVAAYLNVSPRQVGKWLETDRIPCYRLGRRVLRFSLPDVCAALGVPTPSRMEGGAMTPACGTSNNNRWTDVEHAASPVAGRPSVSETIEKTHDWPSSENAARLAPNNNTPVLNHEK